MFQRDSGSGKAGSWRLAHEVWHRESCRLTAALFCSVMFHVVLLIAGGARDFGAIGSMTSQVPKMSPIQVRNLPNDPHAGASDSVSGGGAMVAPMILQDVMANEIKDVTKPSRGSLATSISSRQAKTSSIQSDSLPQRLQDDSSRRSSQEDLLAQRRARYLLPSLLDVSPAPLVEIELQYPPSAGNQQGKVALRLFINESGEVDEVVIVRAIPKGFFEEAAINDFSRARFSPGMRFGRAVKAQIVIEVDYVPFDRGTGVTGRSY